MSNTSLSRIVRTFIEQAKDGSGGGNNKAIPSESKAGIDKPKAKVEKQGENKPPSKLRQEPIVSNKDFEYKKGPSTYGLKERDSSRSRTPLRSRTKEIIKETAIGINEMQGSVKKPSANDGGGLYDSKKKASVQNGPTETTREVPIWENSSFLEEEPGPEKKGKGESKGRPSKLLSSTMKVGGLAKEETRDSRVNRIIGLGVGSNLFAGMSKGNEE
jgi:hypothetical protein